MEANVEYEEYRKRIETIPCAFNLIGADKVSTAKLRAIEHNLDSELKINDGCEQERIIKQNLLTWVRFRLGGKEEALQLSRDVIELAERRNVASLANRSFIMYQTGDEIEAMKCLEDLEKMKSENNFQTQLTDAQAEQAYYYSRLGGSNNLQRAIKLFCDLPKTPVNYLRTFGLGLVYRRMTHMNIVCSSPEHLTVEDYHKRAAECLFEVAEKADNRLSSQAYAQLVLLRRSYPVNLAPECEEMFRWLNVEELCEKALEHGHNIPTVLVQCGKALKSINIDKSIDLLEQSIAIKEDSTAYHHLGLCYKRKAVNAAKRRPHYRSRSEGLSRPNYVGQQRVECHVSDQSNDVSGASGSEHCRPANRSIVNQHMNQPAVDALCGYRQENVNHKHGNCRNRELDTLDWGDKGRDKASWNAEQLKHGHGDRQNLRGCLYESQSWLASASNVTNSENNHGSTKTVNYKRHTAPGTFSAPGYTQGMYFPCGHTQSIRLPPGNTRRMGNNARYKNTSNRIPRPSFSRDIWSAETVLESSVRRCRNVIILNKDDENVQKAHEYFKKAIELANENLPAILDLGILLKDTNQIEDALKQFNNITNNINPSIMYRVIVISAYEQAGLCYLELSRTEGNDDYKEIGNNKLTKAVSIAADLIHTMPELRGSHKEVWIAFTTLLTEIDKEQTPENFIKKFKVLEIAREHGDIIDGIQKLKEAGHEGLTNPDIVKIALASFLQKGQPDNALVYHNIVAMNPLVQDSDWWNAEPMRSLRIKVLLHAIAGCLQERRIDNPTGLCRQLFEFIFGSCVGLRDPESNHQSDTASVILGDVLYIFESDECPNEENLYPTEKCARCLRMLTTCLFGLKSSENMKGTGEYGNQNIVQLKEMLKYQIVIIVLGNEKRDGYFNAMLQVVSSNSQKAPPNQKILVINTGLEEENIPQCLKQYKSLKLADIGVLADPQRIPGSWNDTDNIPYTDIIHHVFDGDVDAVLKLFCFMIEQTWPCP